MPLWLGLLLGGLFFGTAGCLHLRGDDIAAAFCVVTGIGALSGYRAGAASIATLLVAGAAAILLGPALGMSQQDRFTQWFGTTGLTNRFLSIGMMGLLIALASTAMLTVIARKLVRSWPELDTANRWLGFVVGAAQGAAALALFVGGMLVLEPIEQQRADLRDPADKLGKFLSQLILQSSQKARHSLLGPTLVEYNPMLRIPPLNKVKEVQQSAAVLSDPAEIQKLLQHPSIRQLQQQPEVRRVVQELHADPAIQNILRSGQRLDRGMAMTLLSHPAVMRLVDQPGFVDEASRVILNARVTPVSGSSAPSAASPLPTPVREPTLNPF
jgi:uncharacterized membrane protein required for colicin V production